jgi:hypothetical protein
VESGVVVAIALLVLLGGSVVLLTKQRALPWSVPALRPFAGGAVASGNVEADSAITPANDADSMNGGSMEPSSRAVRLTAARGLHESPGNGPDIAPAMDTSLEARLARVESRLEALADALDRHNAELNNEVRRAGAELAARATADDARREAALERLRADLLAAVAVPGVDRHRPASTRRAEVCAELYAGLARLEAALAAVTNPILLPGEPYAPTAELAPEALVWENWKEVGERAFALADTFSARRLHLSEQTRGEVGGFVTVVRTLLTRSVYPNLRPDPNQAQQRALQAALEEIAAAFPDARATLEREYQDARAT